MSKRLPKSMYEEALAILEQSEILKQTVIWQDEQANALVNKYPEEVFDTLSWEEKEKHLEECDEIAGRLEQSVKELAKLDAKYQELRVKLVKHLGRSVLPPLDGDIPKEIGPEDEVDLTGGTGG